MLKNKFFGAFVFGLLLISIISADGADLISPEGVKYDSRIEGQFVYQDRVYVRIHLKDESGIIFEGTKEERRAMLKPHDEWFQKRINETIKDFSEEDFIFHTYLPRGFGMFVTQKGLNKLLKDERINSVSLNYKGGAALASLRYINVRVIFFIGAIILLIILIILLIIKRRRRNGKRKS